MGLSKKGAVFGAGADVVVEAETDGMGRKKKHKRHNNLEGVQKIQNKESKQILKTAANAVMEFDRVMQKKVATAILLNRPHDIDSLLML